MKNKYRTYGRDGIELISIIGEDEKNVYLSPNGEKAPKSQGYFDTLEEAKKALICNIKKEIKSLRDEIKRHQATINNVKLYSGI